MIKEVIAPNNLHRPFGYAHAIQIGNTIYISGQIPLNQDMKIVGKNNIVAQVERAFKTLKTTSGIP
jgi:enamine deaminase RidA (YjgF/YER057c/UK114 family)